MSNEYCSARPTLVALGEPEYDFFPYFVKLNRCGGSCGSTKPTVQECVATEYTEVEISQISPVNGKHNLIKVKNHTKCGCSCVAKPDQCHPTYEMWNQNHCGCQCLYRNSDPPTPCKVGFKWNRASCKCMCARVPTTCGPQQVRMVFIMQVCTRKSKYCFFNNRVDQCKVKNKYVTSHRIL